MAGAALGVDLGGTFARAAVVRPDGHIVASEKTALTDRSPAGVIKAITEAVQAVTAAAGGMDITACGVGAAGQLSSETGVIANAPNLGWREVPLGPMLAAALGRKVKLINDLKAAAWGEFKAGAGKGATDIWVMFVGSGVGSAVIANGRMVLGASGVAGEFGHVKVQPRGRRCGCGELGCLEAYVGGHNLIAQMKEVVDSGRPTNLLKFAKGDLSKLNPVILEQAVADGDVESRVIFDRAADFLGLAVANQVTVLNPSRLILGGGVLSHAPALRHRVVEAVRSYTLQTSRNAVLIEDARLGDDSGVIGSALLALEGLAGNSGVATARL